MIAVHELSNDSQRYARDELSLLMGGETLAEKKSGRKGILLTKITKITNLHPPGLFIFWVQEKTGANRKAIG